MADWSRPFEDPIPLPDGRKFVTLKDAAAYIMKLPKAEQDLGGMADGDRGSYDGGGRSRAADARAHRYVEGAKSARRARF
jgi:hypothetical protein